MLPGGSPGRAGPWCHSQSGSRWAGSLRSTGHGWGPAAGTGTSEAEAAKDALPAVVKEGTPPVHLTEPQPPGHPQDLGDGVHVCQGDCRALSEVSCLTTKHDRRNCRHRNGPPEAGSAPEEARDCGRGEQLPLWLPQQASKGVRRPDSAQEGPHPRAPLLVLAVDEALDTGNRFPVACISEHCLQRTSCLPRSGPGSLAAHSGPGG